MKLRPLVSPRLVQSNPAALQQVLQQLGAQASERERSLPTENVPSLAERLGYRIAQSPDLLQMINQHPQAFVELMNEAVEEVPAAPPGISPEAMAQMMQMMGNGS